MNKEDVKIGLVVYVYGERDSLYKIISIDNLHNNSVTVESVKHPTFIDSYDIEDLDIYDARETSKMVEEIQDVLDETASLFAAAFDKFQEARNLGEKNKFYYLKGNPFDTSKLEQVFQNNGWSTSSLWC